MFSKSGTKLIEKAIGQFDSIKQKLAQGIEKCKNSIAQNEAAVAALVTNNKNLADTVEAAEKAVKGIEKLLNGGE